MPRRVNPLLESRAWQHNIVIEGVRYDSLKQVAIAAKNRCPDLKLTTVEERIRRGATTWEAITAPVPKDVQESAMRAVNARESKRARQRQECAEAMAAVDARRKALENS